MKHLRLFESFKEKEIHAICRKYGITNYTINTYDSIDVDGDVYLNNIILSKLPLKFKNVTGNFHCQHMGLETLEGSPKTVGGHFSCFRNNLASLDGGPESVGLDFACGYNRLTSFEGCPESVGGYFECQHNSIISFEHLPISIGENLLCNLNPIDSIWELFEDYSKIELFNYYDIIQDGVIILDRLNTFLEEIGKNPVRRIKGYKCI